MFKIVGMIANSLRPSYVLIFFKNLDKLNQSKTSHDFFLIKVTCLH